MLLKLMTAHIKGHITFRELQAELRSRGKEVDSVVGKTIRPSCDIHRRRENDG
jgi:hypothetical protein